MAVEIPIRAPGLMVAERPERLVVHQRPAPHPGQGPALQTHTLNNTAALVFEMCSGTDSVEQIAGELQNTFNLETSPLAEVRRCLEELTELGMVRIVGPRRPSSSTPTRVLAITPSRHRPFFLRHCILQMRSQTYPVDHAIYVNGDEEPSSLYEDLLDDRLFLRFGPSSDQHDHYVKAIEAAPFGQYDLFCKIDDDDIYRLNYIEDVVTDFETQGWDFSGADCDGEVHGSTWVATKYRGVMAEFCDQLGVEDIMPPTMALSRKALECIRALDTTSLPADRLIRNEDEVWTRALLASGLAPRRRASSNFIYHVHGTNLTASSWLPTGARPSAGTSDPGMPR
jgi:hypothetical protein